MVPAAPYAQRYDACRGAVGGAHQQATYCASSAVLSPEATRSTVQTSHCEA